LNDTVKLFLKKYRNVSSPHGGDDFGAVYNGRKEKDDVLALTLAVGNILSSNGVDVYYTRSTDIYESPAQKAAEANAIGADYFVSIHRNSSPYPNQYTGVETLVYNKYSRAAVLAANINEELEQVGYENQGVNQRTNLVVLKRTQMPAVLVEVGFINTDADNALFDSKFNETAQAIAVGILETIRA
jgi:N-acetylmuramoyl-L-alanine amidase